jgi:hypothetical protein
MRRGLVAGAVSLVLLAPPAAQAQATPPGGGAETLTIVEQSELGIFVVHNTFDPTGGIHFHIGATTAPSKLDQPKTTESHTGNLTQSSFTVTDVFNGAVPTGDPGTTESGHLNTHYNENQTGHVNSQCNDNQEVTFCP